MQTSIDLDYVSEIWWNSEKKVDGIVKRVTVVTLGTAGAWDPDLLSIEYNQVWLYDDGDRKALYNAVFASNLAGTGNAPIELFLNN